MGNPFAVTFGTIPHQYIPRLAQREKVIDDFNDSTPSTHAYAVMGVRGSGKTVMLTEISRKIGTDWIVVDLNPKQDLMRSLTAQLYAEKSVHRLFAKARLDFSFAGIGVHIEDSVPAYDYQTAIALMLEEIKKRNKKVLVIIDEVDNNDSIKEFAASFQILTRKDLPIFLLVAGLPENIYGLINDKMSTFLYLMPRVEMAPLNYDSMKSSYARSLKVDNETALQLSHMTFGYSFAYQALGLVCWGKDIKIKTKSFQAILEEYDYYLQEFSYVKIWDEMSDMDRAVAKAIARGLTSAGEIQEEIGIDTKKYSVYRDRLKKKGLINSAMRGEVHFALPRFDKFVLSQP